jgi:hypothetical protein
VAGGSVSSKPATVKINSISTTDSTNLTLEYTVGNNAARAPFEIDVYRSTTGQWNQGRQVAIAGLKISGGNASTGPHTIVVGPGSHQRFAFLAAQPDALRPDLELTHVLAVADSSGDLNAADSGKPPHASFTIHVLALIAHGYSNDLPAAQTANTDYATALSKRGSAANSYEYAFAANWASTTAPSKPGASVRLINTTARTWADRVERYAESHARGNDVVDVNFIGYSRGAVLISTILQYLKRDAKLPAAKALTQGYMMETLVDPHPANNSWPPGFVGENAQYSASHGVSQLEGTLLSEYQRIQGLFDDHNVTIPTNVRAAAEWYQHTNVSQLPEFNFFDPSGTAEALLNLWGEDPSLIQNLAGISIKPHNATGANTGHFEMLSEVYAGVIAAHTTLVGLGLTPF